MGSAGRIGLPSQQSQSAPDTQAGQREPEKKQDNPEDLSLWMAYVRRIWTEATPQEHLTLVLTFVIAVSTFFYTIFAGWQLYEINTGSVDTHALAVTARTQANAALAQVEILSKSLEFSQRPWMTIEAGVGGPFTLDESGAIARIKIRIENVGHSPAIKLRSEFKMGAIIGSRSPDPFKMRDRICDAFAKDNTPAPQQTIFPGGDYEFIAGVVMQPEEVRNAVQETGTNKGVLFPVVFGCIDYQYAFDQGHHQTRFLYMIFSHGSQIRPNIGSIPANKLEVSGYSSGGGITAY